MRSKILLVEDDPGLAASLKKELEAGGCQTRVISRGDEGLALAKAEPFDVVITDYRLCGLSGLDLIGQLHSFDPGLPVILTTAYGTPEIAIEAIRLGAFDYLPKPFEMPELLELVARAMDGRHISLLPIETVSMTSSPPTMVGASRVMQGVFKGIGHAANTSMTALIRGETGTGKEVVARAIHGHSSRASAPFVAVGCTALPETLLESELFGHERGAYTGASSRRIGRFEEAGQGTVFLDEIGDLNLTSQVKLLRVLQEKTIQRVGANQRISVGARVLAATHRNLEQAMREGQFREDLFYRLSGLTIHVPPLSHRLDDLFDLVKCFLLRFAAEVAVSAISIHCRAIDFLRDQPWPGNVRQLENVVRHACVLAGGHPITLAHVREAYESGRRPAVASEQTMDAYLADLLSLAKRNEIGHVSARMVTELERRLFSQAIELSHGNQAQAARWLGISRTTVRDKLAQFGLQPGGSGQQQPGSDMRS